MQQAFLTINSNAVPQVFLEAGVLEFHQEGEVHMAQGEGLFFRGGGLGRGVGVYRVRV